MEEQKDVRIAEQLALLQEQALEHTHLSLDHMAARGVRPEGKFGLFLPPDTRQKEIDRQPYEHKAKQTVV